MNRTGLVNRDSRLGTRIVTGVAAGLFLATSCLGEETTPKAPASAKPAKPAVAGGGQSPHAIWDQLLHKHVKGSDVSYKGFKRDEKTLDQYLDLLAKTQPAKLSSNQRLAYWINAYNAFTVKLILSRYPKIKSIKDIPARWSKRAWNAAGRLRSLEEIEHEILRKEFNEPRIHFAINCASKSCPDLASDAYVAPRLEAQLTAAAKRFLTHPTKGFRAKREKGRLWGRNNNVYLSKIFSWFAADFEKARGSVIAYVTPYLSPKDRDFVTKYGKKLSLHYMSYDWTLNEK